MSAQVDPKKVYAVVVGIEKYDEEPSWNVPGPSTAARRFTKLLRDRGVPAENIRLYLAPIDDNMVPESDVTPMRPSMRSKTRFPQNYRCERGSCYSFIGRATGFLHRTGDDGSSTRTQSLETSGTWILWTSS
ncbi:hypothetical protein J8F10_21600 [Gemmata sp. G18]|uniref:Uncharacterized protein n=1 Tax=Gemmata palustris TaxID=2822762 RepID=A0ABS5BVV1_9BACT|nr:hypothetical protein [Gemmata palustris]MBP3957857.1 hypothetical protein [Gemmata palustris]